MALEPNAQITVTLSAQNWNSVLTQIAETQRHLATLMQSIASQCEAYDQVPAVTRLHPVGGEQP
jgi:hypothetical protein